MNKDLRKKITTLVGRLGTQGAIDALYKRKLGHSTCVKLVNGTYESEPKERVANAIEAALEAS